MKRLLVAGLIAAAGAAAAAGVETLAPGAAPPGLFDDPRPPAPEGPPHGRIASRADGDIREAWYAAPTTRYRHGALGDVIEAGALRVRTETGETLTFTLPDSHVFEDLTPRLADLDGDGLTEVATIRASAQGGGAVAIYGLKDGALVEKAATPDIGRPNRWLNIAGIAPYTGGATLEIAYVETPHIGGTLHLWRYARGRLTRLGRLAGFSNHANGALELRLSATADFDGDGVVDLALPSDSRRELRFVRFIGGAPEVFDAVRLPARIESAIVPHEGRLLMRLRSGETVAVGR